jgi:heme-degrading monooxygenase HmoA
MAVLLEMDIEASPEQYDQVDQILDPKGNPPDGLIAHSAQDVGGKMKIVDIWESPEAFGAFAESRLGAAVTQVMGEGGPTAPDPKFTELHNAYSV